ncbi:MAG: hypothetical protein ACM32K_01870, partial [Syntrophaceae bacterium]
DNIRRLNHTKPGNQAIWQSGHQANRKPPIAGLPSFQIAKKRPARQPPFRATSLARAGRVSVVVK